MKTKWLKRMALLAIGLGLHLGMNAQENLTALADTTGTKSTQQPTGSSGGGLLEYLGIDNGFGMGLNFRIKYVMVGYGYTSGKTDTYITENNGWNISAGGDYQHWLGKWFYVEGAAGLGYFHGKTKTREESGEERYYSQGSYHTRPTYETKTHKNGEVGLFINPRIGIKLFNSKKGNGSWALTASYRWNFLKFKFKKGYINDYFTVGLAFNG